MLLVSHSFCNGVYVTNPPDMDLRKTGPPPGYDSFKTPYDYPNQFVITQKPGTARVVAVLVFK